MLSQRAPFAHVVDVASLVAGASWLAISGYVLLEEGSLDLARRCAAVDVRRAVLGCDVPAERIAHWRAAVSAARPDMLFLNADEAEALGGATDLGALVVVTGRDGVRATGPGVAVELDGAPAAGAPVDTTGAGDALAAAVIAHIGAQWPVDDEALRAALAAGIAAARRVVGVPGAQGVVEGERGAAR
jgi:sugar/nucleoside kinase (ribokinase family)